MLKGWTQDYGLALFGWAVALFSLWQIQKALRTGKIFSVSSWSGLKDRKLNPLHFWGSLIYYIVWVFVTVGVTLSYFAQSGRLSL
jgi:hypothetical protein